MTNNESRKMLHILRCFTLVLLFIAQIFVGLRNPMKLVSLNFHSNVILRNSKPELEKYSNPFLQWVSILLPTGGINSEFEQLDWTLPKRPKSSMGQLIIDLEKTLKDQQWFVTGLVDPTFFLNEFQFKDPNVEVVGIQNYA